MSTITPREAQEMAQRVAIAQRVASRAFQAASYQDYVKRKKREGKKPLSKADWQSRLEGGPKDTGDGGGSKGGLGSRILTFVKGLKPAAKVKLKGASEHVQNLVTDKAFRGKAMKSAASRIKKAPGAAASQLWKSAKGEVKSVVVDTPVIVAKLLKEKRKPTKAEMKTLYGTGVYVAGTVLGAMGGGAAWGASKALLHSLSLHIGIKAVSGVADDIFLHGETAESFATGGGLADKLPFSTSDIPGLGPAMEFVRGLTAAEGEGPDEAAQKIMERMVLHVARQLEQGLSDEEMRLILEH